MNQIVHPSFFTYLGVYYQDQESKCGDIWLHTGPPQPPDYYYDLCDFGETSKAFFIKRMTMTSLNQKLMEK